MRGRRDHRKGRRRSGGHMSSMPERETPGQPGGSTQQSARPGEYGPPAQGSVPGQEQYAGPGGGMHGQPGQTQYAGRPGYESPVSEGETRVTWRRIFQFWIDAFLVWIVPYLVSIPFDVTNSTALHIIGGFVSFVLFILIGIWYWIVRPYSHNGQTFAMEWLGIRVISKNGGPVSMAQLFIRWISLIFDGFPWFWPFTGLLGLLVMLGSRYRQRIGDHLARTLVVSTRYSVFGQPYPSADQGGQYGGPGEYAQGGQYGQSGPGQYAGPGRAGQPTPSQADVDTAPSAPPPPPAASQPGPMGSASPAPPPPPEPGTGTGTQGQGGEIR